MRVISKGLHSFCHVGQASRACGFSILYVNPCVSCATLLTLCVCVCVCMCVCVCVLYVMCVMANFLFVNSSLAVYFMG